MTFLLRIVVCTVSELYELFFCVFIVAVVVCSLSQWADGRMGMNRAPVLIELAFGFCIIDKRDASQAKP